GARGEETPERQTIVNFAGWGTERSFLIVLPDPMCAIVLSNCSEQLFVICYERLFEVIAGFAYTLTFLDSSIR
ncbi:MAG: hypothetical protein AAGJ35_02880, partial [Myxococcota bacterium]